MIRWGNINTLAALRAVVEETAHLAGSNGVFITMTAKDGLHAYGGIEVEGKRRELFTHNETDRM